MMPALPDVREARRDRLRQRVLTLFQRNYKVGYSTWNRTPFAYIAPARHGYPHQWLWDTAFHAIVLCHLDPGWAEREIENFLRVQAADGFLPHVVFWDEDHVPLWGSLLSKSTFHPHLSAITQPPVLAIAVEAVYSKTRSERFLEGVLPALSRYHDWLERERDPDRTGLLSIISADESGMDELPIFQYAAGLKHNSVWLFHFFNRRADVLNKLHAYRLRTIFAADYFTVKDLLFNCLFIEAERALARLLRTAGDAAGAARADQRAAWSAAALMRLCWDGEEHIFYPLYSRRNKRIPVKTVTSLVPLFLSDLPPERADRLVKEHVLNQDEFFLKYPFPSVSKDEAFFAPEALPFYWIKALWRGPTWFSTNWLLVKGLRKHGYDEIADLVVDRMVEMIDVHGFREYFNPLTGQGYGKRNFGWSALLLDLI
ncbi:MAG TPA: trehalase family glycosidase [Chloroflexota bacterium]|jgi:glycogen debranching enzyme|nr:trehalase family glycosidase [Chloroflexota bacterium]